MLTDTGKPEIWVSWKEICFTSLAGLPRTVSRTLCIRNVQELTMVVIRFSGWKILAPEVESELAKHPLVSDAIVLGVQDTAAGQLVAALAVINEDVSKESSLGLSEARRWLAVERGMNAYKLPTIMRLVEKNQELPMTLSGKYIKRKIRDIFFNQEELQSDRVEVHDLSTQEPDIGDRPFDWAGIQAK